MIDRKTLLRARRPLGSTAARAQRSRLLVLTQSLPRLPIVKLLLDNGADIEVKDTEDGHTPVWWAAKGGHENIVKLLLDNGANFEEKDTEYGQTSLPCVAINVYEDIAQQPAVHYGNGVDVSSKDMYARCRYRGPLARTSLSYAAMNGHEDIVQLLPDKAANFDYGNGVDDSSEDMYARCRYRGPLTRSMRPLSS